jgi:SpoVK/Ycf46/Vps4 family AAA+-type ATPase
MPTDPSKAASRATPKSKTVRPLATPNKRVWVISKYAKQRLATAEAMADQLQLPVNRIDLSEVVSKYIGETEKNLSRVLKEAENTDAVLLLDESDALFGERTTVSDAHDRYANKEISYLLERLERFPRPVVIATRRKHTIDSTLLRRLRLSVVTPLALPKVRPKRTPTKASQA